MLVIGSVVLNLLFWATHLGSALLVDENKEILRWSLELVTYCSGDRVIEVV